MILILGKNGYVSKRFQKFFDYKGIEYKAVSIKHKQFSPIIQFAKELDTNVELVINCVGFTGIPNVDSCEDFKQECLILNSILPDEIATLTNHRNIPLIHISSGCIYESRYFIADTGPAFPEKMWATPFQEDHTPNFSFKQQNCSWYSGTKALGESLVRKTTDKHYICRLRMPFNHIDEDKNYISKILKYPKVWSILNSLTNIDEFVQSCYNIYTTGQDYGTYNITNPGGITAKEILEIAKEYGLTKEKYEYFESLEEFNKVIKAPRSNCVLDTEKLEKTGHGLLPVEQSLRKCFESWNKKDDIIFW